MVEYNGIDTKNPTTVNLRIKNIFSYNREHEASFIYIEVIDVNFLTAVFLFLNFPSQEQASAAGFDVLPRS